MRNTLRTNNSKERIDGDSFHQRRKSVTSRGGALKKFDKETKLNRVSSSRNKKGGALGTLKNLIAKKALKDLIKEPIYSKRGPQREEMSSVVSFEAKNIVTELFNKGMHRKISFKPKFGKREIKLAKDEARELDRISPNPNVAEAMCKTYREGLIKRVRSLSVPDRSYQEKRIFRRKRSVQNKSTTEGGYIENALMQERQEKISHQILNTKAKLKYFTKERNKSFLKREIEIHNLTENRVKRHKLLDIGSGNSEIINNSKNKRNLNDLKSLQVDIRLKQLEEIEQMRLAQIRTGVQFKQMIREIKESFMKMANMKLNLVYVNPTKIEFVDPDAIEIPTTQRTDSNDREEKEKSIQDQLDLMDEMRFREKQLVLEEIIRENRFNWIPNIAFIDLFKKCLSSKEMYNLHFNEQELFRLYSILIHLPIFRSYTQKEILEIFYSSTIREIPKSTQEFYKGYLGIYIILRGSLVAGNKRLLTKGGLHQDYPIEDLEITPELNSEEPTNMYFELSDGSYITSNIFKFFPKREGPYTQRIKLEFTETTTLMQIKVNDISRPIIERHQHYDFYKRLDYLSNHKGFAKLGFFTLLKLAREIVTIKKDYGTSIFKVGQESPGLYIIREGSVSITIKMNEDSQNQVGSNWSEEDKKGLNILNPCVFDLPLTIYKPTNLVIDSIEEGDTFGGHFLMKQWANLIEKTLNIKRKSMYTAMVESETAIIYCLPRKVFDNLPNNDQSIILEYIVRNDIPNSYVDYHVKRQVMQTWVRYQEDYLQKIFPTVRKVDFFGEKKK